MALDTFANLKTSVGDWLNRDDLTSVIPDFITLTEARLNREIRHWRMEKRATVTLDSQYTALPTDFLAPIRLHVEGSFDPLRLVSQHVLQDMRNNSSNTSGEACYYAITGGEIEVYPTHNTADSLELSYYRTIPALSDANTSNWVLANFPDAYLYGALMQSAPYLVEDSRIQTWGALFTSAIMDINKDSDAGKYTGAKQKRLRTA